jgi:hypothetical protein
MFLLYRTQPRIVVEVVVVVVVAYYLATYTTHCLRPSRGYGQRRACAARWDPSSSSSSSSSREVLGPAPTKVFAQATPQCPIDRGSEMALSTYRYTVLNRASLKGSLWCTVHLHAVYSAHCLHYAQMKLHDKNRKMCLIQLGDKALEQVFAWVRTLSYQHTQIMSDPLAILRMVRGRCILAVARSVSMRSPHLSISHTDQWGFWEWLGQTPRLV